MNTLTSPIVHSEIIINHTRKFYFVEKKLGLLSITKLNLFCVMNVTHLTSSPYVSVDSSSNGYFGFFPNISGTISVPMDQ